MNREELERVAALITERNAVDAEIGAITGRPVVAGHLGEWIAAQVFDICARGHAKREGNLDLARTPTPLLPRDDRATGRTGFVARRHAAGIRVT
jgi:hypothetical protein